MLIYNEIFFFHFGKSSDRGLLLNTNILLLDLKMNAQSVVQKPRLYFIVLIFTDKSIS